MNRSRILSLAAALSLFALLIPATAGAALGVSQVNPHIVTWQLPAGPWSNHGTYWSSGSHLSNWPGPGAQSQTFTPWQTLVGEGDAPPLTPACGQWAQVDYYKVDSAHQTLYNTLIAGGVLIWVNNGPADSAIYSSDPGYGFRFVYGGPCPPTIATLLSEWSGQIGDTVHDSAILTGATSEAGGSVQYTVYTDSECTLGAIDAGKVTVGHGVVPDSNGIQFNSAGTWYWQAVYTPDANNLGATSDCTSEPLVIAPASPTIATLLSESSGQIGDTVHDSALLTGATSEAGGSVQYTVYTDSECTLGAIDAGKVTVANALVPDSNGIQFNSAGTWYWQAVYTPDANNLGATSDCTSETLVIPPTQAPPTQVPPTQAPPTTAPTGHGASPSAMPKTATGGPDGSGDSSMPIIFLGLMFLGAGLGYAVIRRRGLLDPSRLS